MKSEPPTIKTEDRNLAEALNRLAYAVRTVRLAPHDERLHKHVVQEVMTHLQRGLDGRRNATLQVLPFELRKGNDPVYSDHNRAESLAVRLFRDGIATVTLGSELTPEGLTDFVAMLSIPHGFGEDLVTQLWRSPIDGIVLAERPGFALELLTRGDGGPLERFYQNSTQILNFLGSPRRRKPRHKTCILTFEQWLKEKPEPTENILESELNYGDSALSKTFQGLSTMLETALHHATDETPKASALLLSFIRVLLLGGERALLYQLYARLINLREDVSLGLEEQVRLEWVMEQGASPDTLAHVLRGIGRVAQNDSQTLDWLPEFFATYTTATPDLFCGLYSDTSLPDSALRLLTQTLWRHPKFALEHGTLLLDEADPEVVLEFLRALAELNRDDPMLGKLQLRACLHRDSDVRCQAISDFADLNNSRFRSILLMSLKDGTSEVRIAALGRLGEHRDPAVGILLVDRIRRPEFWLVSKEERGALLALLVKLGAPNYGAFLFEQLNRAEKGLAHAEASGHGAEQERQIAEALLDAIGQLCDAALVELLKARTEAGIPTSLERSYQEAIDRPNKTVPPNMVSTRPIRRRRPKPREVVQPKTPAPTLAEASVFVDDLLEAYLHEDTSLTESNPMSQPNIWAPDSTDSLASIGNSTGDFDIRELSEKFKALHPEPSRKT